MSEYEHMEELQEERVEGTAAPAAKKSRLPLTHSLPAKIAAFFLVIFCVAAVIGSAAFIYVAVEGDFFLQSEERVRQEIFDNLTSSHALDIAEHVMNGGEGSLMANLEGTNVSAYSVVRVEEDGRAVALAGGGGHGERAPSFRSEWIAVQQDNGEYFFVYPGYDGTGDTEIIGPEASAHSNIVVTVYLQEKFTEKDDLYYADKLISLAFALRDWIFVILAAAFILAVFCFIFLLCASGRRKGCAEVQPGWGTKVPFDLLTIAAFFAVYACIAFVMESTYYWEEFLFVVIPAAYLAVMTIFLGWCMSFALRLKLKIFWKGTLLCWGLGFLWSGLRFLFRSVRKGIGAIALAPLCVAAFAGIFILELAVMLGTTWTEDLAIWWVLEKIVLFGAMLYLVVALRKLERGGEAIAAGNLSYQVDTRSMPAHFRRHGENLNRIGEGMTAAVEERLKSERMKTELITNVSHDIKTPLTSIINYADLISKEPCDNPVITEHAAVLHRQSERLKRLIEDLVEASKASSGSIDISPERCDAGVFIQQAAGEYALRLQECSLQLITEVPDVPIFIMADGRRLWRVMDNLMSNVCKYAQSGTRVYLTLHAEGPQAVICVKNISRDALNIAPEELMERFVRGDTSRFSEGSGLGLSIARSLAELQGGTMDITVDGDLFKVTLRFPAVQ